MAQLKVVRMNKGQIVKIETIQVSAKPVLKRSSVAQDISIVGSNRQFSGNNYGYTRGHGGCSKYCR